MTKESSKNQDQKKPSQQVQKKQVEIHAQYLGPIPPPNHLSAYEDIHPGLADRIMTMAEKEQHHRQELEQKDMDAAIKSDSKEFLEARLGQVFALIIGLAVIVAGAYCVSKGHPISGTIFGGSVVVALVSVFIWGRKEKNGNNNSNKK